MNEKRRRGLREAIDEASDGDEIVLLKGRHFVCGSCVDVDKRIFIHGETASSCQETVIDQRANSPALRLKRTCALANVTIDFMVR